MLTSSLSVTLAHHRLIENYYNQRFKEVTIKLGLYFTALEAYAWVEAPCTISKAVNGFSFSMATGFYGIHVIVDKTF